MEQTERKPAVLFSIRRKWDKLILSGKKTLEIRKTAPKRFIGGGFKGYIYECGLGVTAEFRCRLVYRIIKVGGCDFAGALNLYERACMTFAEMDAYLGDKEGYGIAISDLKIYEKPRPITDFVKAGTPSFEEVADSLCPYCEETDHGDNASYSTPTGYVSCEGAYCQSAYQAFLDYEGHTLTRPPQSWCYVEEPG